MQILVGNQTSETFHYGDGVRQGCPASPELFILFMDRLQTFLDGELRDGTRRPPDAHTFLGWWLPILLFADDIVLLAKSIEGLQLLLDKLSIFAEQN